MAKIVEIQEQLVVVKDGINTKSVPKTAFAFEPLVGDEVKIYQSGTNVAVLKIDPSDQNIKKFGYKEIMAKLFPKPNASVNKWLYCALAFLFGGSGIHKFYAGKWKWGLVYFLLNATGISCFLSIIDLIIALTKHTDAQKKIMV